MVEQQTKPNEGKEEAIVTNEAPSIGHVVKMYHYVLTSQKSIVDKQPLSDGPA